MTKKIVVGVVVLGMLCCGLAAMAYAGQELHMVPQQSAMDWRKDIVFSPDSRTAAVSGNGVELWNVSGQLLRNLRPWYKPLESSPDNVLRMDRSNDVSVSLFFKNGAELAAASTTDDAIRFFDTGSGEQLRTLAAGKKAGVWSLAISADGNRLAAGTGAGTVKIWDLRTGKLGAEINCPAMYVTQLAFLSGGELMAASRELFSVIPGGVGGRKRIRGKVRTAITLWDRRGALKNTIWRDTDASCPAFSVVPGNEDIGVVKDANVEILDKTLSARVKAAVPQGAISGYMPGYLLFSPDGKKALLGGSDGKSVKAVIFAYPGFDALSEFTLAVPPEKISRVAFSPDSSLVGVVGGGVAEIHLAATGAKLNGLDRRLDRQSVVAAAPKTGAIAAANPVRLWDWTGAWLPNFYGYIYPGILKREQLRVDPVTKELIISRNGEEVRTDDMGMKLAAIFATSPSPQGSDGSSRLAFSPNGRYLFLNSGHGNIRIMDLDGRIVGSFPAVPDTPIAIGRSGLLAFLWPDGRRRDSGNIKVVELASKKLSMSSPRAARLTLLRCWTPKGDTWPGGRRSGTWPMRRCRPSSMGFFWTWTSRSGVPSLGIIPATAYMWWTGAATGTVLRRTALRGTPSSWGTAGWRSAAKTAPSNCAVCLVWN